MQRGSRTPSRSPLRTPALALQPGSQLAHFLLELLPGVGVHRAPSQALRVELRSGLVRGGTWAWSWNLSGPPSSSWVCHPHRQVQSLLGCEGPYTGSLPPVSDAHLQRVTHQNCRLRTRTGSRTPLDSPLLTLHMRILSPCGEFLPRSGIVEAELGLGLALQTPSPGPFHAWRSPLSLSLWCGLSDQRLLNKESGRARIGWKGKRRVEVDPLSVGREWGGRGRGPISLLHDFSSLGIGLPCPRAPDPGWPPSSQPPPATSAVIPGFEVWRPL